MHSSRIGSLQASSAFFKSELLQIAEVHRTLLYRDDEGCVRFTAAFDRDVRLHYDSVRERERCGHDRDEDQ